MAAALLAGCGDSSDDPTTASEAAAPPTTATTTETTEHAPELDPGEDSAAEREARERRRKRREAAKARPNIVDKPIPFGADRKQQMSAYSERHYGEPGYRLTDPQVIVEHYTASNSFDSAYNTFANNAPDVELHELPGVCSHFIIDSDGTIYQLVPVTIRCRHTVGLNYTSVGIEHVGTSDAQVTGNAKQLESSLRLTNWLRCTLGIKVKNVIGHNENTTSPFHKELVPELKTQTHGDFAHATMNRYRDMLSARDCE